MNTLQIENMSLFIGEQNQKTLNMKVKIKKTLNMKSIKFLVLTLKRHHPYKKEYEVKSH